MNEPTGITDKTAAIRDQKLTNAPNFVITVDVTTSVSTNDHCTIGLHLNVKMRKEKAFHHIVWLFKKADFVQFRNGLESTDIDQCFTEDNSIISCERWTESFLNVARTHVPSTIITV